MEIEEQEHRGENVQSSPATHAATVEPNYNFFYMLVLIFEVLCMSTLIMLVYWGEVYFNGYAWDGSGLMFNWHPLLMVLGLIILYGNAAISYRLFRNSPKFTIKLVHAGLHAFALLFVIIGLVAVFGFHNHNNIPNMYSLHSWIGIGTVVLFCGQYLAGFTAFLFPKFGDDFRATALKYHQFMGRAILYLAVVACVSGLTEKMLFSKQFPYSKFPGAGNLANAIGVMIALIAILVTYIVYEPNFKREEQYEKLQ